MEDKMARISQSMMLKNIAANLRHLRVRDENTDSNYSPNLVTNSVRRTSILTEPHQQLIQQHESEQLEKENREDGPAASTQLYTSTPSPSFPNPSTSSVSSQYPTPSQSPKVSRASTPGANRVVNSPRLMRKPSPVQSVQPTPGPPKSQHKPQIVSPTSLSTLVVNPTAHKQTPNFPKHHFQDTQRLVQDLYKMGFRPEVAEHAAQQYRTTNANDIARILIQQKNNFNASNLMSKFGSLDNINMIDETYPERSQSPIIRCNNSAHRSNSPIPHQRPPSPKLYRRTPKPPQQDNVPMYSPYSAGKNYMVGPGYLPSRPNEITYLKFPRPSIMSRDHHPVHVPHRGYGMGRADYDACDYYEDDYCISSQVYSQPPHYTSYQDLSGSRQDLHKQCFSPPPQYPGPSSTQPPNPYMAAVSHVQPTSHQTPTITAVSPQHPYSSATVEGGGRPSSSFTPYPEHGVASGAGAPPGTASVIQNPTYTDEGSETPVSVQERVKIINQNIASQNTPPTTTTTTSSSGTAAMSPQKTPPTAIVSPKLQKKSEIQGKGSKAKKGLKKQTDKASDTEDKPRTFKMFSPLPKRKSKPQKPEYEYQRISKPTVSSEAVKFILEQRIENLMKETANKAKRRDEFEKSITNCSESEKEELRKEFSANESRFLRLRRTKINKDMFTKIQTIGIGSFGEVSLVQKTDTGQLYAMKTLRKAEVWKRNQTAHVKAERDILSEADNEWVVKLHFSFQDTHNLYFVMDYIPGGDMMSLLIKCGKFPEHVACFYIAELVCAVESVHSLGFIHRDIKPDNILIDAEGHLKLTDFGLCTGFRWTHDSSRYQSNPHNRQYSIDFDDNLWQKMQQNCPCGDRSKHQKPLDRRRAHQRCLAHSLVGTPNYIAPEVLLREWYNFECDWWSVGVIFYEMVIGRAPFNAASPADTQMAIMNWRYHLSIPVNCISNESINLIFELLQDSEKRLGKGGAHEIKNHSFFESIKWNDLHNTPAPFVPDLKFPTDTSYFDSFDEEREKFSDNEDDTETPPTHPFYEFTFRRFSGADIHKDPDSKSGQNGPVLV